MYLLDTNVISELRRPERANPQLVRWADGIPAAQFFLSAISLLEIELEVLQVARKDQVEGRILRAWIDGQILVRFNSRILAVDATVALRCASLNGPDQRSERDALIAATAIVHGMTVVTRNVHDFESTGVQLFNPWASVG